MPKKNPRTKLAKDIRLLRSLLRDKGTDAYLMDTLNSLLRQKRQEAGRLKR